MTTSLPLRSVSLCQRYSASWPNTSFAAWNASSSQLLPGKTTIPNFMSVNLDAVALDHGIRQHLVGDFGGERACLGGLSRRQVELEVLSLTHVGDRGVAERLQRVGDRLALRIEHRRLQCDVDTGAHAATPSLERV